MICTLEHILQCSPTDVFPHISMLLFAIGALMMLIVAVRNLK